MAISKFHRKRQIPQLGSKFRGSRKTVGPSDHLNWKLTHQLLLACEMFMPILVHVIFKLEAHLGHTDGQHLQLA